MRRYMILGGWYALCFAAILIAGPRKVSSKEATLRAGPSDYDDPVGTAKAGDSLNATGKIEEGFVQVTLKDGKLAWISNSELFSLKQEESLKDTTTAGGGAGSQAEGAYVKGFDPEVEGKMREDHPDLDKVFKEEVLPWVWAVRAGDPEGREVSRQLETLEEDQERFLIQNKPTEAAGLQKQIDDLRRQVQASRDKWQSNLKAFRKAGKVGEFAVSK